MRSHLVTAVITALVCFCIAAGVSFGRSNGRTYKVGIGQNIYVPSVDLFCGVEPAGRPIASEGADMYCERDSTSGDNRAVVVTRYRYYITGEDGKSVVYRVGRTP